MKRKFSGSDIDTLVIKTKRLRLGKKGTNKVTKIKTRGMSKPSYGLKKSLNYAYTPADKKAKMHKF